MPVKEKAASLIISSLAIKNRTPSLLEINSTFSLIGFPDSSNCPKSFWYIILISDTGIKLFSLSIIASEFALSKNWTISLPLLYADFRAVDILKSFSDGVILDCTHSTQKPKGDTTGGDRELAKKYALAAKIFEYDGVFIETHPDPKNAISDADSQVELEWIREHIYNIW